MSWLQQTDEQQRRHEEELAEDRDNWIGKEPPWWHWQEYKMWKQEQEDGHE